MTILAIETTGTTCGACIARMDESGVTTLLTVHEVYLQHVHDAMLGGVVQQSLDAVGISPEELDVVAVSGGPGSFTGTRIGVSFAKGLCFSGSPRLMLVDTLHAIAEAAREVALASGLSVITTTIPSHADLVFSARYTIDPLHHDIRRDPERVNVITHEEARLHCAEGLICGPGAPLLVDGPISGLTRLSSRFIALRAAREIGSGIAVFADPHIATPLYRQDFVGRTA